MLRQTWTNLVDLFSTRWLIFVLARQDVLSRYRSSVLGFAWAIILPIVMLMMYSIFYQTVFGAKWSHSADSQKSYTLMVFSGLIIHAVFIESLTRSSSCIIQNPNFVKRVSFRLEAIPASILLSSWFQFLISFGILIVAAVFLYGFSVEIIVTPLALVPLFVLTLGLSFIFASLGTFLRDFNQLMTFLSPVLMFTAPIFYPMNFIPERYQMFLYFNPLTIPIGLVRACLMHDHPVPMLVFLGYTSASIVIFFLGMAVFRVSSRGFSDAL
jgi:lipopolysaccharide transport system permease protein